MISEILKNYNMRCISRSDISALLPILRNYAEECEHITEFGVRDVVSTYAFLVTNPKKLISYDIVDCPNIEIVKKLVFNSEIDFKFIKDDTRNITIEETDLLFIDTLHTYDQLRIELFRHESRVKKYIIMHDTTTFGTKGEDGKKRTPIRNRKFSIWIR